MSGCQHRMQFGRSVIILPMVTELTSLRALVMNLKLSVVRSGDVFFIRASLIPPLLTLCCCLSSQGFLPTFFSSIFCPSRVKSEGKSSGFQGPYYINANRERQRWNNPAFLSTCTRYSAWPGKHTHALLTQEGPYRGKRAQREERGLAFGLRRFSVIKGTCRILETYYHQVFQ